MTRIASTAAAGRVSALRRRARYIPASISAPMITINKATGANIGCALLLSRHPMRAEMWRHLEQAAHRAAWSLKDNYQIGRAHSELPSLMRIAYAVFCLKKKKQNK